MRQIVQVVSRFRYVVCFVGPLFFASCFDYDEEMWLNADLSGHAAIKVSVQEEFVKGRTGLEYDVSEDAVRKEIERIPGVKLDSFKTFRDAGNVVDEIGITFDSVEKLSRYETKVGDAGAVSLLGNFKIDDSHRKILFERTVPIIPRAKGSTFVKDLMVQGLSSLLLGKSYLDYRLHIPGEIINANTERIDGRNRLVEWKFTLAQAVRDSPHMEVQWKKSGWQTSLVVMILALIAGIGVFLVYKRASRRRAALNP